MQRRNRCSLATAAVAVLTVVVVTQALFLLSLMHSIHNNGALDEEESKAHSFTQEPSAHRERSVGHTHHTATWGELLETLRHPNFPRHYETNRTLRVPAARTPLLPALSSVHNAPQESVLNPRPLKDDPTPQRPEATKLVVSMPPHTISPLFGSRLPRNPLATPRPSLTAAPTEEEKVSTPNRGVRLVPTVGDVLSSTALVGDTAVLADVGVPESLVHLKDAAVVILCYNRPQLLERTIAAVRSARLSSSIKKYISQDGNEGSTRDVARGAQGFTYLSHPRTLAPTMGTLDEQGGPKETPGTMYLAAHYRWILDQLFKGATASHSHVIILEDDMKVSHDFFELFESLAPILDVDPSVWCISSWNDNGFRTFELPKDRFFRSSYFPGLGWMLRRSLWVDELSDVFPSDNWDHWMRATTTSRNRECISPWLSRNYNMGSGGATANEEFYAQFLEPIASHRGDAVAYGDVRYLLNGDYYKDMEARIQSVPPSNTYAAPAVSSLLSIVRPGSSYLIHYLHEEFELLAQMVGIHPSPRSFYRRVLWLKVQSADVFIVDRRLSPFAPPTVKRHAAIGLVPVKAPRAGMNCLETCMQHIGVGSTATSRQQFHCAADQFDFINDCTVLSSVMGGCPNGCTQGWGEDIPNTEVNGVGHPPLCLATEVSPTCEASFPLTQRLCPCVGRSESTNAASVRIVEVASTVQGTNCDRVCASYVGTPPEVHWRCSAQSIASLNSCDALRKHFPCKTCSVMDGAELPSYVGNSASGNFGKCFYSLTDTECAGSHPDTRRLCPCTPL